MSAKANAYYCKNVPVPKDWKKLQLHPLATISNFGEGIDLKDMAATMKEKGYDEREPIILVEVEDGTRQILDGRHKFSAAQTAGVTPTFVLFQGADPRDIVAKKVRRQHLNISERSRLARALSKEYGNSPPQNGSGSAPKDPPKTKESDEAGEAKTAAAVLPETTNTEPPKPSMSQKDAAKVAGVSVDSVQRVAIIEEHAIPQLRYLFDANRISLTEGARIAVLPVAEQKDAIKGFFCERCNRGAWTKNCHRCAEMKKSKQRTKKPAKVVNGEPVFDLNTFTKALANALAELGKLARQYGFVNADNTIKDPPELKEMRKTLEAVRDRADKWRQKLSKQSA